MAVQVNGNGMGSPSDAGMELSNGLSQSMDSIASPGDDEVRTLFVSGLPMDAKPRELYLLFRSYKGYETALLKNTCKQPKYPHLPNCGYEGSLLKVTGKNGKSTSPVGFVTFADRASAEIAKGDLQQGIRFDPDLPQTLRLEFAKSNTKVTKPKQQSPQPAAAPTLIHPLTGQELAGAFFPGHGPEAWGAHPALAGAYGADLNPAALLQHHGAFMQHPALAQVPVSMHQLQPGAAMVQHAGLAAAHTPTLPTQNFTNAMLTSASSAMAAATLPAALPTAVPASPSNTLFVANLGAFCSEQELKDLFNSFPGFVRMKLHNKGGTPVAFVEYQEARYAADAMNRLQGFILLSSERGGIRIEYAKNKVGEMMFDHAPRMLLPRM